jgi:hypothetical protein
MGLLSVVDGSHRMSSISTGQVLALQQFARLEISVEEFLSCMEGFVRVGSLEPANREVYNDRLPADIVDVRADDILWALRLYLKGRVSGQEISNWAGLLLALDAFHLPTDEDDDSLLGLLTDIAVPLDESYLDREEIKKRLASGLRPQS